MAAASLVCFWSKIRAQATMCEQGRYHAMPIFVLPQIRAFLADCFAQIAHNLQVIFLIDRSTLWQELMMLFSSLHQCFRLLLTCSGVRHALRRSHLLGPLRTFCSPPINVASVQGSFTICHSQHSECVRALNFVFHTNLIQIL